MDRSFRGQLQIQITIHNDTSKRKKNAVKYYHNGRSGSESYIWNSCWYRADCLGVCHGNVAPTKMSGFDMDRHEAVGDQQCRRAIRCAIHQSATRPPAQKRGDWHDSIHLTYYGVRFERPAAGRRAWLHKQPKQTVHKQPKQPKQTTRGRVREGKRSTAPGYLVPCYDEIPSDRRMTRTSTAAVSRILPMQCSCAASAAGNFNLSRRVC